MRTSAPLRSRCFDTACSSISRPRPTASRPTRSFARSWLSYGNRLRSQPTGDWRLTTDDWRLMLDPILLTSIADLELVARVTVDGTISGLHRSPFHGYSAEFSQYRHYRPGDDLKYVDWKLFARTDRIYTKQYRETTNLMVQIAVDASASMSYAGAGRVSKLDYARVIAAALAH